MPCVLREAWTVRGGHLEVPDRPGLGVDLDEEALAASPMRPSASRAAPGPPMTASRTSERVFCTLQAPVDLNTFDRQYIAVKFA